MRIKQACKIATAVYSAANKIEQYWDKSDIMRNAHRIIDEIGDMEMMNAFLMVETVELLAEGRACAEGEGDKDLVKLCNEAIKHIKELAVAG